MRGLIGRPEAPALSHRDEDPGGGRERLAARLMETAGSVRTARVSWLVGAKSEPDWQRCFPQAAPSKVKVLACMHALNEPDRRCHPPESKCGPWWQVSLCCLSSSFLNTDFGMDLGSAMSGGQKRG